MKLIHWHSSTVNTTEMSHAQLGNITRRHMQIMLLLSAAWLTATAEVSVSDEDSVVLFTLLRNTRRVVMFS